MSESTKINTTTVHSNTKDTWYKEWFNTPYYHTLYKDRNDKEAQKFITNLSKVLNFNKHSKILDLACGKGRHSLYLNKLGYDVCGEDLSENSINYAKQFENSTLKFRVRNILDQENSHYDAVLNLFTSFGYFNTQKEDLKALENIKHNLKPDGIGVIDFMNCQKVIKNLVQTEEKEINGILFQIRREIIDGFIQKHITFVTENKSFNYTEKVKIITLIDFQKLFDKAGLTILNTFGNYNLEPFNVDTANRLILVFKKK